MTKSLKQSDYSFSKSKFKAKIREIANNTYGKRKITDQELEDQIDNLVAALKKLYYIWMKMMM